MPQIHGEADGAEVTIEGHVAAEFTEHAHDGRSDDGRRWTGRRPFHGWPRCRRCGRVSGRGGDQEAIDGEQTARELRLETLFFLAKKGLRNSSRRKNFPTGDCFAQQSLLLFSSSEGEERGKKKERKKKLVLLSEI